MENNVAFYEASKDRLKSELAAVTAESTRIGQLFGSVRAEVDDLQNWLCSKHVVIPSIVKYSFETLRPSL